HTLSFAQRNAGGGSAARWPSSHIARRSLGPDALEKFGEAPFFGSHSGRWPRHLEVVRAAGRLDDGRVHPPGLFRLGGSTWHSRRERSLQHAHGEHMEAIDFHLIAHGLP